MALNLCTKKAFRFSDYCRRRKSAVKSKVVAASPREDGVNLRFVLKKRKSCSNEEDDDVNLRFVDVKKRKVESKNHGVLRDSELESRVFGFASASGAVSNYSGKMQGIGASLARICKSEDALRDCGRLDNYERLDGISRGAFGAVYRARDRRTGEIVAMKDQFDGISVPTLREIDIFKWLGPHPRIIEFKEVVADDSDGVYIMMECAEGDLQQYMEEQEERLDAKAMMQQLLEGVKFLHEKRVMHRDLKPANILIGSTGCLKICDFGLSRRIDVAAGMYAAQVGTKCYRAPELLKGVKKYTEAVDMWAVGCVMAEMLLRCGGGGSEAGRLETVCKIVGGGDKGYERLRSEFFPEEAVSGAGFDLLKGLLCCDPSKRITAVDALNHVWFLED
ncbi:cyclin-dependent kinase G-2-like [Salvia miltiorrhiza]|uniref:cyclin-dependent kinase G-2-like n=1 Tax=Salvia miltiorrhiza TaxID=226208 RepID=UPI0025ABA12F|nr:cyclin-dependent kinase G-2-like [Salvia miltiorrhiza]